MDAKDHSTLFYIVFGGFWLLAMLLGAMAAAIVGDREIYDDFRGLWARMRVEVGRAPIPPQAS